MEPFEEDGIAKIRFEIHPLQKQTGIVLACQAPIADRRMVSDSGGYKEMRYVINTILVLGTVRTRVEMTLTGRGYRVVSDAPGARSAIAGSYCVDPAAAYLAGRKSPTIYKEGR